MSNKQNLVLSLRNLCVLCVSAVIRYVLRFTYLGYKTGKRCCD